MGHVRLENKDVLEIKLILRMMHVMVLGLVMEIKGTYPLVPGKSV